MVSFDGVQETLLIPLAIKASETKRPNARIQDRKAVEIVEQLDLDVLKYDKFMSHEGVVARTILFDEAMAQYVKSIPDRFVFPSAAALTPGSQEWITVRSYGMIWTFLK